jgi:hypothetical protein
VSGLNALSLALTKDYEKGPPKNPLFDRTKSQALANTVFMGSKAGGGMPY